MHTLLGLDAATEIHRELCFRRNATEYATVYDMLRLRPVKVHHMQALEAQCLKLQSHIQGFAVDRFLVVVALRQAHALSVDNIYGWYQFYLHPI